MQSQHLISVPTFLFHTGITNSQEVLKKGSLCVSSLKQLFQMVPIISSTEGNAQPAYFFLRGVIKGFERETKGEGNKKQKKGILGTPGKECFHKLSQFSVQTFERTEQSKQTHPDTAETAELGAVGAQAGIPQLLHANKTSEHLGNALQRGISTIVKPASDTPGLPLFPRHRARFLCCSKQHLSEGDTACTPQLSPSASPTLHQQLVYNTFLFLQGILSVCLISFGAGLSVAKIFLRVFTRD